MKTNKVIENLKYYIMQQLDNMSGNTPIIHVVKPIITRVINNNINKVYTALNLVADENGEIDVENIVTEVIDNLSTSQPFVIHTSFIGDIEMGNGLIKANIPFTNKKLVLNRSDLDSLKDILTSNQL